jgi:hypothetical protein
MENISRLLCNDGFCKIRVGTVSPALARLLSRRLAAKVKKEIWLFKRIGAFFGELTHILPACAVPKNAHGLVNNNSFKVRALATYVTETRHWLGQKETSYQSGTPVKRQRQADEMSLETKDRHNGPAISRCFRRAR